jgi:anti-sigma regulatory factor (Ser/Thr protein kinase)
VAVIVELRATLRAEPEQVAEARRLVSDYLRDRGEEDGEVAVLLTSELVTNAILYGHGPLELRAHTEGSALRIEVRDQEPASPPVLRSDADLTEIGGRGLQLVDTLADRWGWSAEAEGKVVWFELDA